MPVENGQGYFARIAAERENLERAGLLWGAIEAEDAHGQIRGAWGADWVALVGPLLEIEDPAFERGRAEGRRLTLEEAAERAQLDE